MRVVPAVLANTLEELLSLIKIAESFSDYIQIDIMDGAFVPSKSVSHNELMLVKTDIKNEIHLMVKEPESYLKALHHLGTEQVIFHYEAVTYPEETIKAIKDAGFRVGMAINPETPNSTFERLVSELDTILYMAVNPGFYGAPFIPGVLDKIKGLRSDNREITIGIDGGIKLDNAVDAARSGVDFICIGSAIFKAEDPAKAYRSFVAATASLRFPR